jgi:hypothetical protein
LCVEVLFAASTRRRSRVVEWRGKGPSRRVVCHVRTPAGPPRHGRWRALRRLITIRSRLQLLGGQQQLGGCGDVCIAVHTGCHGRTIAGTLGCRGWSYGLRQRACRIRPRGAGSHGRRGVVVGASLLGPRVEADMRRAAAPGGLWHQRHGEDRRVERAYGVSMLTDALCYRGARAMVRWCVMLVNECCGPLRHAMGGIPAKGASCGCPAKMTVTGQRQ